MKHLKKIKIKASYIMLFAILLALVNCSDIETINLNRPQAPQELMVSQGDTSVFMNWAAVNGAASYTVIRGLEKIAENLTTTEYVDPFGPDSPIEYRVYAVNEEGWRSIQFAKGNGFVAIPPGILPRPPAITATTDNFQGVELTWDPGRFATSYNLYRGDELIAEDLTETTFFDTEAPTNTSEYKIFSVNYNGESLTSNNVMGNKAFFYIDTYEDEASGTVINPWTFRADPANGYGIAYYTEGSPMITAEDSYDGSSQSFKVTAGRVQMLVDWGGVPVRGNYKFRLYIKQASGGTWLGPNFAPWERLDATGDWQLVEFETGVIDPGTTFNLNIDPDDGIDTYIDNWAVEYISED